MMLMMLAIIIIGLIFAGQGIGMHSQVPREDQAFNELQDSYFTNSKVVRDQAETGSDLNKDLVRIQQYPSQLMMLKLIGVGKILIGIFVLLLGILVALMMMPVRLGKIIKGEGGATGS